MVKTTEIGNFDDLALVGRLNIPFLPKHCVLHLQCCARPKTGCHERQKGADKGSHHGLGEGVEDSLSPYIQMPLPS